MVLGKGRRTPVPWRPCTHLFYFVPVNEGIPLILRIKPFERGTSKFRSSYTVHVTSWDESRETDRLKRDLVRGGGDPSRGTNTVGSPQKERRDVNWYETVVYRSRYTRHAKRTRERTRDRVFSGHT